MYAAREQIYPREAKGRYATWRWVCVWLTQLAFYGLPWLTWNGRQALLFDLTTRKFYIFGVVLWPQDFIYLARAVGISPHYLNLIETGEREPDGAILRSLARVLEVGDWEQSS